MRFYFELIKHRDIYLVHFHNLLNKVSKSVKGLEEKRTQGDFIGMKSYMDTELPDEMELNDISVGLSLEELEQYALLYLSTEKWHKHKRSKKTDEIVVLPKKDRQLLSESQLVDYYDRLLNYYFYTKNYP